jgi:hypothetical protein
MGIAKRMAKVQNAEDDVERVETLGSVSIPWKCGIDPISAYVWCTHHRAHPAK